MNDFKNLRKYNTGTWKSRFFKKEKKKKANLLEHTHAYRISNVKKWRCFDLHKNSYPSDVNTRGYSFTVTSQHLHALLSYITQGEKIVIYCLFRSFSISIFTEYYFITAFEVTSSFISSEAFQLVFYRHKLKYILR